MKNETRTTIKPSQEGLSADSLPEDITKQPWPIETSLEDPASLTAPKTKAKIDPLFFEYAQNRSAKARNELIKRNTPLVSFLLSKFYGSSQTLVPMKEDLMQEGLIGLMHAIEGFRPELGFRFSTYAAWWIRQHINNFILNVEPIIHIPSHVRIAKGKLHKQLLAENTVLQEYIGEHEKAPAKPEALVLSERMLESISKASQTKNITSIDVPARGGGDSLRDSLPSDKELNTEILFGGSTVHGLVKTAMEKLSEKERLVLMLRFDIIKNG